MGGFCDAGCLIQKGNLIKKSVESFFSVFFGGQPARLIHHTFLFHKPIIQSFGIIGLYPRIVSDSLILGKAHIVPHFSQFLDHFI